MENKNEEKWEEVNPISDRTWNAEEEKTIQGIYLGRKDNVGPKKSTIHTLKLDTGEQVGVWGSTVLDNQLKMVSINDEVKIEYLGMEKSKRTGNDYKNFKVLKRPAPFQEVRSDSDDIPVVEDEKSIPY